MSMVYLEGYHGTYSDNGEEILRTDFKNSIGDDQWLGDGVYFFVDGLNKSPSKLAQKWIIAQSMDKKIKTFPNKEFCVIKSDIEVDESKFLDLTTSEGVEVFAYICNWFRVKYMESGTHRLKYSDAKAINYIRNEQIIDIDVLKSDFCIKFALERVYNIRTRINNCTICGVYNTSAILSKVIVSKGNIQDEINSRT